MSEYQYTYPVEQLDELIDQIDMGITPMLTEDLKVELNMRRLERSEYIDEDEEMSIREQHEAIRQKVEAEKRKSHSRNVAVLTLTAAEQSQLEDDMSAAYVRNDPNSFYNTPDEKLADTEERRQIIRRLQTLGKCYYNQKDYMNAISIIREAIDFSLSHDYPWMTREDAIASFNAGGLHFGFTQMPNLFVNFHTQITDPRTLAGIASGEIDLVDPDDLPAPKKKRRKKGDPDEVGVRMDYTVIGPAEHEMYVKQHQLGHNTPISVILKSHSTVYNRYVMPMSFSFGGKKKSLPEVDWDMPGAGKKFFEEELGYERNPQTELVAYLNQVNGKGELNHTIGNALKWFMNGFAPEYQTSMFHTAATPLQPTDKAVQIESKILDMIRMSNPNI